MGIHELMGSLTCIQCTGAAHCYVCVSVGHNHEPYKNDQIDQSSIWGTDTGEPNHVLGGVKPPGEGATSTQFVKKTAIQIPKVCIYKKWPKT